MARSSFAIAMMAAALMLAAVPMARAGGVFEVSEVIAKNDLDYKFNFDKTVFGTLGAIATSSATGAGAVFGSSIIPLHTVTLNKCSVLAAHIHPNAAETVVVLEGKVRLVSFRGETDGNTVRTLDLVAGEAGYLEQGSVHYVQNICNGHSKFMQIFDHPQPGVVFAANALANMPTGVINKSFSKPVFDGKTTAFAPLYSLGSECETY